ncbi:MAG TPA: 30S ribosomal protein S8 [Acidiferrobacteraceae bacterium]|nr:30S ribosomal protein S8 [Acidiferrobacteraceae bacterium]
MMTDPIADMLTRIRNAQMVEMKTVSMPASTKKQALAQVLKDEGYISAFEVEPVDGKPVLRITLKYHEGRPVIERIQRVSKPGQRVFRASDDLPSVAGGFGIAVISTSQGLMTDRAARKAGVGGEIWCLVA